MPISFNKLLEGHPCWFQPGRGEYADILISTMGRMVRDLPGHPFPGWSTAQDRAAVAEALLPALGECPYFKPCFRAEMPKLTQEKRLVLLERKQLTPCMAARQDGCHLLISKNQNLLAMVNEEEHLCVHAIAPGLDIPAVCGRLQQLDSFLRERLTFASTAQDGYLTSLPAEAGDGLQLYAVMHLPALVRAGMLDSTRKGLEALGCTLSPFYAESGEEAGNLYVVFTQAIKRGGTDSEAERFARICRTLAEREWHLRDHGFRRVELLNDAHRAYAILLHSKLLDFKEMISLVSMIRWGAHLSIFTGRDAAKAEDIRAGLLSLYETMAPAHLRMAEAESSKWDALQRRSQAVADVIRNLQPAE